MGELQITQAQLPYLAKVVSYPLQHILCLVPYELASYYRCVPIGEESGVLTLATERRLPQAALIALGEATGHIIFQVRCGESVIEDILQHWQHIRNE